MQTSERFRLGLATAIGLLTTVVLTAADSALVARGIQAHVTFLADDQLEGRGTGTRGHALAAHYVSTQFARLGIGPGADGGGYTQPIKFLESTSNREAGRLIVRAGDKEDALTPVTDMFVTVAAGQTTDTITAAAVFVGFGVQAFDLGYDDFAGVDLRGKIAVVLSGAPKRFPSEQRAHHAQVDQKRTLLVQHGAIGMVTISTPWDEARRPWAITAAQGRFPAMRLLDSAGQVLDGYPQLRVNGVVGHTAAGRILTGAPKELATIFATAERGEPQNFPLPATITLAGESSVRPVESVNVLGWLAGSDPALAREPIVITGHLDHLGIGAAVNGDTIYNGAMDNAMGISVILTVAEELAAGPRLRRPVLFAAVTGEEKGLLGSRYLAAQPPTRVKRFAANVNIDMPLFIVPAKDVIAFGAEHSTLAENLKAVASHHGITVSPDPLPDEVRFVRSDQYSFVRQGVPAICLTTGERAVDPAVDLPALATKFRNERYHRPSDDLAQPIDWNAAGAYAALMTDLCRSIANDPKPPAWLPGDFFGELFGAGRK